MTVNDILNYLEVKNWLDIVCEKWAKEKLEDWKCYNGYDVKQDYIEIHYSYLTWNGYCKDQEIEHGSEIIRFNDIVEYGKLGI